MKRFCLIVAMIASLGVAACTVLPGPNRQGYAGITDVRLKWCKTTDDGVQEVGAAVASALSPGEGYSLCSISWVDGKEKGAVTLHADLNAGTIDYSASTVLAFDGQALMAAVQKAQVEAQAQGAKDIAPFVLEAVKAAIGVP